MQYPLFSFKSALGLFALVFIAGCSQEAKKAAPMPAPQVSVFNIGMTEVGGARDFVARTEASKSATIKARVEGELIARHFREGSIVEADTLLFEIDPASYIASLNQAKAELESKESAAERAKRNLKRGQEVAGDGFISQSDLDKLIAEDLQAKAAVSSAEAALEQAELNLSYTKISAPFTGRIGKADYDVGNVVGPTSGQLALLQATDPVYAIFQVDESSLVSFRQAQAQNKGFAVNDFDISLRLPNNTKYSEKGKLVYSDTQIEAGMGTVEMRTEFPNKEGIILPGLFVTLLIESSEKEARAMVPQAAVQSNQQGKFVLLVDNENKVRQRMITLGRRIDAMWVVESGLEQDERVIIEGVQKVRAGGEVKPLEKTVDPITGTVSDLVK
ncbi:efflux RND transporter periplasmic adaptor subunit [Thalassotalea euphylliae]|uniref:efflux RND transporter periplasmic adaptor subunit n=1 Tax=Thalassotalea euphylliae TaxID=1655234 RepID=UPI0036319ED5